MSAPAPFATMRRLGIAVSLAAFVAVMPAAHGQTQNTPEEERNFDQVIVDGNIANPGQGRLSVNVASGSGNQQAASAVIASGGSGISIGSITQHQDTGSNVDRATEAIIAGNAFAGSQGLISVNIVAGSGNQEANLAIIATGLEGLAVSDATLAQSRSSAQPSGSLGEPGSSNDVAILSPNAFEGSQGLVQVNLIGGERNSSANIFALTMSAGGKP